MLEISTYTRIEVTYLAEEEDVILLNMWGCAMVNVIKGNHFRRLGEKV